MIERVVENWLNSASERSFQLPFCYILQNQGHKILHLTRHRPMEFGKDVITIDSEGNYHAYQLKQGFINQRIWTEIFPQLAQLCYKNLAHPHVPKDSTYIPYLVTNGGIDEEVYRGIDDFNEGLEAAGRPALKILKYDDLYTDFLTLGAKLWPTELADYKKLIEFTLFDGDTNFPTEKFISLLESQLELSTGEIDEIKNLPSAKRQVTSSALLTSYCTSSFLERENHVAVIEAWVIYMAQVNALILKLDLDKKEFEEVFNIAKQIIFQNLQNLTDELEQRKDLFEGNIIFDLPFYGYRATRVIGLISVLFLWIKLNGDDREQLDRVSKLIKKYLHECRIISEAHLPYFLSIYWAMRKYDSSQRPVGFLKMIIETIIDTSRKGFGLANPYYKEKDLMPIHLQNILKIEIDQSISLGVEPLDDSFEYTSFYLNGLVHIFARLNYKQEMRFLWPSVTHFRFKHFQFEEQWHFFKWRNKDVGKEKSYLPNFTQSWKEMREIATNHDEDQIPMPIINDPIFGLLFLLFYPHRVNPDLTKFLDSELRINLN
ncbi:MAG: hypothetical protein JJU35_15250 [Balneolales bacterium]|nr:hypothetical protein [Balneolales bacterium]